MMEKQYILGMAALILSASQITTAATRVDVFNELDQISSSWSNQQLNADINGTSENARVTVGQEVKYGFSSSMPAHITAVHVDSHGKASVLLVDSIEDGSAFYPPKGSLWQTAPLGKETVYVIASDRELSRDELGVAPGEDFVQSDDSVSLVKRVVGAANKSSKVALAKLQYWVDGSSKDVQHKTRAIIRTFAQNKPAKISAQKITFAFDSEQVTPQGAMNLDTFGEALLDEKLSNKKFVLGGHTDDVGSAEYNKQLSKKRAESAKQYLVQNFGVEPSRLIVKGYGESSPLVKDTNEDARSTNRRVEFTLIK